MKRNGFTLVELLLVLVLLAIIIGIATPYFVNSIRGNRLRVAGRTLVTVSRYARSMAVLKQAGVNLNFNLDDGEVDVVGSNITLPRFTRALEGVRLESVTLSGGDVITEGLCTVPYYRTGTCRAFDVRIVDAHGGALLVKVDSLGSVRVLPE